MEEEISNEFYDFVHQPPQNANVAVASMKSSVETRRCSHGPSTISPSLADAHRVQVQSKNQRPIGKHKEKLSTVLAIGLEGVHAVNSSGGWEEVKLAFDSGATETVIPPHVLQGHELHEGAPFKRGVEYEVATGVQIHNLGEKRFVGLTTEGAQKGSCRSNLRCQPRALERQEGHQFWEQSCV